MMSVLAYLKQYNYPKETIKFIESLDTPPILIENKLLCILCLFTNAVTVYPYIYVYSKYHINKALLNHELIHWFQQLFTPNFYFKYFLSTFTKLSYRKNVFELEAYENDLNYKYILKWSYWNLS